MGPHWLLMWVTFGLACYAIELIQMAMPRYDAGTLRVRAARKFRANPI